jgi:hypothetical protein
MDSSRPTGLGAARISRMKAKSCGPAVRWSGFFLVEEGSRAEDFLYLFAKMLKS